MPLDPEAELDHESDVAEADTPPATTSDLDEIKRRLTEGDQQTETPEPTAETPAEATEQKTKTEDVDTPPADGEDENLDQIKSPSIRKRIQGLSSKLKEAKANAFDTRVTSLGLDPKEAEQWLAVGVNLARLHPADRAEALVAMAKESGWTPPAPAAAGPEPLPPILQERVDAGILDEDEARKIADGLRPAPKPTGPDPAQVVQHYAAETDAILIRAVGGDKEKAKALSDEVLADMRQFYPEKMTPTPENARLWPSLAARLIQSRMRAAPQAPPAPTGARPTGSARPSNADATNPRDYAKALLTGKIQT